MAIAYRSSGTFVAADATTSGSIGLPAGLANGDTLILPIHSRGTGNTVITPSGYTRVAEVNITNGHRLVVFTKYVTNAAGEVAPNVTHSVSALIAGRLSAFSGVDSTTQLDVVAQTNKHTDLATVTAKSITPVSPSAMIVWIFSSADNNTLNAATQGTTAYSSDTTTGVDGSLALVYELQGATVAASGTTAMTQSANGPDNWNTVTLALRPAAVAPTNPATALFDSILYDVDIAFGAAPFTPNPVWTRVTADLLENPQTIEAGRQGEFSPSAPGTMTGVRLANATRKYDPEYAAGPYFGQLNPFTRIRIWARYSSTNYPLFTGYIKSWPQSYIGNQYSWVDLEAVDLFAILNRQTMPETALTLAVLSDDPHAYFPMFEDTGQACTDRSGNGWACHYGAAVQHADSFILGEPQQKCARLETFSEQGVVADFSTFSASGVTVENTLTIEMWFQIGVVTQQDIPTIVFYLINSATSNQLSLEVDIEPTGSGSIDVSEENSLFVLYAGVSDASTLVGGYVTAPVAVNVPCHAVATLDSAYTTHSLYLNGQLMGTQDVSAGTFNGGSWDGSIGSFVGPTAEVFQAQVATYETTLTAAQVLEHYEAGIAGGLFETVEHRMEQVADFAGLVDAGLYDGSALSSDTYLGVAEFSGTVLTEMQSMMVAEQGRLFVDGNGVLVAQGRAADWGTRLPVNVTPQTTFGDDPTLEYRYATFELEPASTDLTRNVITVDVGGGAAEVVDANSVIFFGPQNESISTNLSSITDAINLGLSRLRRYAQPTARVNSMTVDGRDPDVRDFPTLGIQVLLGMELGWRITVVRRPQGLGTEITREMTVEGIVRTIGDGTFHMTMYLVPAHDSYTAHPWFIVGDPVYGVIGAAAGNKIPR